MNPLTNIAGLCCKVHKRFTSAKETTRLLLILCSFKGKRHLAQKHVPPCAFAVSTILSRAGRRSIHDVCQPCGRASQGYTQSCRLLPGPNVRCRSRWRSTQIKSQRSWTRLAVDPERCRTQTSVATFSCPAEASALNHLDHCGIVGADCAEIGYALAGCLTAPTR